MKNLLITVTLITSFLSLSTNLFAQNTLVPDNNFEQALIDLGYDSGSLDGSVLTANIDIIDSLNIDNKMISNLTGIQDFTALTTLTCDTNLLTGIDLSQNTALIYLNVDNNQLPNFNLTQNTLLKELKCSNNQLTNLDLTQNTALTYLNITNNQLTNLGLTQNTALTHLYCSYTQLTSLDVTQNTALIGLYSSANQLTSLDVTQNTALTSLYCNYNLITNLDITQNPSLNVVNCRNNQLTSLDVTQNTIITYLFCTDNQLTSLDLTQNSALNALYCNNNDITSLILTQNPALIYLTCDDNQLTCLNVKNGNNTILADFYATNNTSLTCIEVDAVTWSASNWTNIDAQTSFSTNCNNFCSMITGISENTLLNLSIYPNPTNGVIHIDLGETQKKVTFSLINNLGQIILSETHHTTNYIQLNTSAPKGVYFLKIEKEKEFIFKKIIIE